MVRRGAVPSGVPVEASAPASALCELRGGGIPPQDRASDAGGRWSDGQQREGQGLKSPSSHRMLRVKPVQVGSLRVGGGYPLAFILGPCVIESAAHVVDTAIALKDIASRCGVPVIFK